MANNKRTPPAPPDDGGNPLARQRIIGHGLRAIREELGASEHAVAEILDLDKTSLRLRESGDRTMTPVLIQEHLAALVLLASRPR